MALLLVAVRWRRPVAAWLITAVGVGTATVDAALWVAFGSAAGSGGYAWQVVLAVILGVAAMVTCRSGLRWIRRDTGSYDMQRITRALGRCAGAALVVGVGAGAALWADWPAVADRLLHLIALVGAATAISAIVVLLSMIGEQRCERRAPVTAEMYRRLNEESFTDR